MFFPVLPPAVTFTPWISLTYTHHHMGSTSHIFPTGLPQAHSPTAQSPLLQIPALQHKPPYSGAGSFGFTQSWGHSSCSQSWIQDKFCPAPLMLTGESKFILGLSKCITRETFGFNQVPDKCWFVSHKMQQFE